MAASPIFPNTYQAKVWKELQCKLHFQYFELLAWRQEWKEERAVHRTEHKLKDAEWRAFNYTHAVIVDSDGIWVALSLGCHWALSLAFFVSVFVFCSVWLEDQCVWTEYKGHLLEPTNSKMLYSVMIWTREQKAAAGGKQPHSKKERKELKASTTIG